MPRKAVHIRKWPLPFGIDLGHRPLGLRFLFTSTYQSVGLAEGRLGMCCLEESHVLKSFAIPADIQTR